MIRVTNQMLANTTVNNLWADENQLQQIETQLTSGKKLNQISDNPQDGAQALTIMDSISQTNQYLRNTDQASAWLSATDNALSGIDSVLQSAQQLAVQGANGTLSTSDRQAMAQQVDALTAEVAQFGNSTYAGSYLFNGADTTQAPFTYSNGTVTYSNNNQASATASLVRQIGQSTQVQVNTVGHDPSTGQGLFDTIFNAMVGFKQALDNNDTSAIQSSITQLQSAEQTLIQNRASVGARMNQVTTTTSQLTNLQTFLNQSQANLVDADMVQAATDYSQANIVLQAGLTAAGKALPPTLFDYLA